MSDRARKQFVAGLRALAGFYEARPGAYYDGMRLTVSMYAAGAGAPRALAAMAAAFAEEDEGGSTGSRGMDCAGQHALVNPGCGGAARAALARDFSAKVRLELFVPGACCRHCGKPAQGSKSRSPSRILERCVNVEMGQIHGDWMVESGTR